MRPLTAVFRILQFNVDVKEAARWVDVRANATKFTLEWNGILGFNLVPAVAVKQDKMMLCKLGLN